MKTSSLSLSPIRKYKGKIIGFTLLVLLGTALGLGITVSGWTDPTAAPPNSNVLPPVRLQSTTPGTAQTGNLNISGTAIANLFSGSGANLTSLNASNLASGTVGTARLGSGTASSSTYLRGDQTWAAAVGTFRGARAYRSGASSIASGVWTKIQLNAETFDTNGEFDSTTNFRFQPTTAGYYHCSGSGYQDNINSTQQGSALYKNGSVYASSFTSSTGLNTQSNVVSDVLFLNGSTDYVELYGYHNRGSANNYTSSSSNTWLSCYKLGN